MDSLFPEDSVPSRTASAPAPLSERIRPRRLDDVAGQEHLLGQGAPLRGFVDRGELPSMILWGPPGTGKTTLAGILATSIDANIERLSAVDSGVKDLRDAMRRAEIQRSKGRRTVVFIDEIHRFNKAQQDALLHAVEDGAITLIGATTENPSFEVNSALLSRCHVYVLRSLPDDQVARIIERAVADFRTKGVDIVVDDMDSLLRLSAGDARKALNALEAVVMMHPQTTDPIRVNAALLSQAVQRRVLNYDKHGDNHYDTVSAFIKSMRGSDPDAALFYLAVMIDAGEDPTFIARRMIIFASEDVGNADPRALGITVDVFQAIERIGMPEGRIVLAQGVTYLATAPKSNASYMAIDTALAKVRDGTGFSIPMHLRNAPTALMKKQGHAQGYEYPHTHPDHFVRAEYLPESAHGSVFYKPTSQGAEQEIRDRHYGRWPEREER
ncbi:MAG: replication-associated recombination protein A [Candidatus Kapabacteria bacterium]|nr:replication-associated recombination protein A [Candidatus Kapabacteria bacterium]